MIWQLFAIIAPLLVCAGIGYAWARLGRDFDSDLVTSLIFLLGTPCLVFSTLLKLEVSPAALGEIAMAAALALAIFMAVASATLKLLRLPFRPFLPALSFPNTGNMGLPLCLFAFGEVGLALGIAFFAVISTAQFTLGMWISSGQSSPRQLARTPQLYAIALSLAFMLTETPLPAWIANTTELIGAMTIPLMLITLGVSLARLQVAGFARSLMLSLLRLGLGLAVGLGLVQAFGFEGATRGVVIIQCAMPVAVFNYLFAQRFNREPEQVAGMVVLSTIVTFAALPLLLLVAL